MAAHLLVGLARQRTPRAHIGVSGWCARVNMKDVELYVRYTAMIVALIVARRAPALSSMAGCQEFLFGAGGGRHPSEDMRGARRVAEARICRSLAYLTRPTR